MIFDAAAFLVRFRKHCEIGARALAETSNNAPKARYPRYRFDSAEEKGVTESATGNANFSNEIKLVTPVTRNPAKSREAKGGLPYAHGRSSTSSMPRSGPR
jgi:hypothetical protein